MIHLSPLQSRQELDSANLHEVPAFVFLKDMFYIVYSRVNYKFQHGFG